MKQVIWTFLEVKSPTLIYDLVLFIVGIARGWGVAEKCSGNKKLVLTSKNILVSIEEKVSINEKLQISNILLFKSMQNNASHLYSKLLNKTEKQKQKMKMKINK